MSITEKEDNILKARLRGANDDKIIDHSSARKNIKSVLEIRQQSRPATNGSPVGLIISGGEFVRSWKPPDFIVRGIFQRGFLYTLTAPKGTGKTALALSLAAHVALGRPLGDVPVKQGRVLYLAGENPDDIKTRWKLLAERMGFDPETTPVDFIDGVINLEVQLIHLVAEAVTKGPYAAVIVDTKQAYFRGDDENANVQSKDYAQLLRKLTQLKGKPFVLVAAHPPKNGNGKEPAGGGAFINEIDANAYLHKRNGFIELRQGDKWRGPEFEALPFELVRFHSPTLNDVDGNPISSVMAKPFGAGEGSVVETRASLLAALQSSPGATLTKLAKAIGLPEPEKSKATSQVSRMLKAMAKETPALVEKTGKKWFLAQAGQAALSAKNGSNISSTKAE